VQFALYWIGASTVYTESISHIQRTSQLITNKYILVIYLYDYYILVIISF